jgi:DNA-binding transcriptional MerR regulator
VGLRQAQLLNEVSLADRLADVEFTVGQVCRIAGITKMQLDYWTVRGAIPTRGKKQRLYDARACEVVMLIKQARDLGFDVNAAIAAARDFQATREAARSGAPGQIAA